MNRFPFAFLSVATLTLVNCGGGNDPASPTPSTSSMTPVATTSPKPTPAPTPDPRIGLSPGPVTRYTIKLRTVNAGEREAVQDSQGRWVVAPGERVDFDSTQKNDANQICQWIASPVWFIDGQAMPFETSNQVVYRRGSSQPFLLKLTIEHPGTFTVQAEIDGVRSNVLDVQSR